MWEELICQMQHVKIAVIRLKNADVHARIVARPQTVTAALE
jgi:hypothetical protein